MPHMYIMYITIIKIESWHFKHVKLWLKARTIYIRIKGYLNDNTFTWLANKYQNKTKLTDTVYNRPTYIIQCHFTIEVAGILQHYQMKRITNRYWCLSYTMTRIPYSIKFPRHNVVTKIFQSKTHFFYIIWLVYGFAWRRLQHLRLLCCHALSVPHKEVPLVDSYDWHGVALGIFYFSPGDTININIETKLFCRMSHNFWNKNNNSNNVWLHFVVEKK